MAFSMHPAIRDQRGIVIDWLIKLIVILVVVGVVLFEVVAVVLVRATAADTASKAAQEAGFTYRDTRDEKRARQTAEEFVEGEGVTLTGFDVDTEEDVIRVEARKEAKTLFIHRFEFFQKYVIAEVTQTAPVT